MNTLLKEFELISLISEDVDERIMSGFFYESASSSDGRGIFQKALDKIKEIIQKMKDFANSITEKIRNRRDEKKLKKMLNDKVNKVNCEFRDKEITKVCKVLADLTMQVHKNLRKINTDYMSGKISAEEAIKKIEHTQKGFEMEIQRMEKNDPAFKKGEAKLMNTHVASDVASYFYKMDDEIISLKKRIEIDCQDEAKKYGKSIKKDDEKSAAVKVKLATAESKIQRICTSPIVKIAAALTAVIGGVAIYQNVQYKKGIKEINKRYDELDDHDKNSHYDQVMHTIINLHRSGLSKGQINSVIGEMNREHAERMEKNKKYRSEELYVLSKKYHKNKKH